MSRAFNKNTVSVLKDVSGHKIIHISKLYENYKNIPYKEFYNLVYRQIQQGFLEKKDDEKEIALEITPEGLQLLNRFFPKRDGVWKLVIFDIPEKHKYVRNVLRARLKLLNFKKWQNSIWISPFFLDAEIEEELKELGKKFFIRLIKSSEINVTEDLEKMFKE